MTILSKSLLLLAAVVVFNFAAHAQTPPNQVVTTGFKAELDALDAQLRKAVPTFNRFIARLESNKLVKEQDVVDPELDQLLEPYARGMNAALGEALNDAKNGNAANLQAFEDLTKAHEEILKRMDALGKQIEAKIRSGSILVDKPLLEKATPAERGIYRKSLDPDVRKNLEQVHPELFKSGFLDLYRFPVTLAFESSGRGEDEDRPSSAKSWFTGWLTSPAQAAIAASCVAVCWAGPTPPCFACIAAAGPLAATHWGGFLTCWSATGKPPWIPLGLWHTGCVTTFVAIIG